MSLNVKTFLKDKKVLYVVMFVSVVNFFLYLLMHNWSAAIIFTLIGYLSTYFSKNMIVVLLTALVSTNMIIATRIMGQKIVEGMSGSKKIDESGKPKRDEDKESAIENNKNGNNKNGNNKEKYTNKSDINYAATLENAYDNLDSLIGKDGIDKMSQDTAKLVSQQNKLLKNLENMAPLLENAGKLLESMPIDGISKIQNSLGGVIGNLKGIQKNN
jgi:hypothetical protein